MRFTKYLLLILCALVPIIHAKLLPTLGLPYYLPLAGNFEFTKVMFFNILVSIILLVFLYEKYFFRRLSQSEKLSQVPHNAITIIIMVFVLSMLGLSTYFSISPFTSLIGDTDKGHTALMYFNLLMLYLIVRQLEVEFIKKLLFVSTISVGVACLIAMKEYYFPSYDYAELSQRALGTFGHPNYLAGIILTIIPISRNISNKILRNFLLILFTLTLLLTKSFTGFIILGVYLCYLISFSNKDFQDSVSKLFNKKLVRIYLCILLSFSLLFLIYVTIYFLPEKFHSFLSRFYIWETTLSIVFSDIKNIFIGAGAETLPYYFNSFKVPELYIFENFGFTADRAHNSYLDMIYNFGLMGLIFISFLLFYVISQIRKGLNRRVVAVIIFCVFGLFHYFSIASYLIIILILTSLEKDNIYEKYGEVWRICQQKKRILLLTIFSFISLFGAIGCISLVRSEIALANGNLEKSISIFSTPTTLIQNGKYELAAELEGIKSQDNLKAQIVSKANRQELCNDLVSNFPSVENYFYCGEIFATLGKDDLAKTYYKPGISELPDLWNQDSRYWDNYFIKHSITGNRFFSKKFGNIQEIVDTYGD